MLCHVVWKFAMLQLRLQAPMNAIDGTAMQVDSRGLAVGLELVGEKLNFCGVT